MDTVSIPETGFLRLSQVLAVFPVKRSTWYLGVLEGRYPKPHKLGPRSSAWRAEDIRQLISQAERNDKKLIAPHKKQK